VDRFVERDPLPFGREEILDVLQCRGQTLRLVLVHPSPRQGSSFRLYQRHALAGVTEGAPT